MKHSIKRQVAFIFIGLMAGTLLICVLINNSLLPRYYEEKREKALMDTYEILNVAAWEGRLSSEAINIELEKISGRYNIMGVVQDMNGYVVGTFGKNSAGNVRRAEDN